MLATALAEASAAAAAAAAAAPTGAANLFDEEEDGAAPGGGRTSSSSGGGGACRPASLGGAPAPRVAEEAISELGAAAVVTLSPGGRRVHWRQRRRRNHCGSVTPGPLGLTDDLWRALRDDSGRVTDLPALLRAVHAGGVAPHLRRDVWPVLLGVVCAEDGAAARAAKWAAAREEHARLAGLVDDDAAASAYYEQQGAHEPWGVTKRRVCTDSVRTAADGPLFRGGARPAAVARLERLLLAYALHDAGTGYCQGMADLAAPFVHLYVSDAEAFAAYRCMMRPLAPNFQEGLAAISGQLRELRGALAALEGPLLRHLDGIGAAGLEAAFQMLLLLFRRELAWGDTLTFWEALWAGEAAARAPLRVFAVAALFSARRRELLRLESLDDLVVWVNGVGSDPACPLDPLALAADAYQMHAFLRTEKVGAGCGCAGGILGGGGGGAAPGAEAARRRAAAPAR